MNVSSRNRLANAKNPYQGDMKKVLCVCSAGLLRSPTIAWILSNEPFGYNTRACGAEPEYALIPLDDALVFWADEVVVVEQWQKERVLAFDKNKKVHVIETPDMYGTRDPELIKFLTPKLREVFIENSNNS
jgi:predicted protein tyrosine phosphatase